MIAASTGIRACRDRARRNARELSGIEDRLGDRELRAGLDLVGEAPQLLVEVQRAGIDRDADVERRRARRWAGRRCRRRRSGCATTLVRPIESTSKHRRRVRVVADLRRIAGDEQHVAHAHRVRAEQIRLHAEQVPVAAGVVKDRFDAGLLLDQDRRRQRAHPRAGARAVGDVHQVDAVDASAAAPARRARRRWKPRGGTSSTLTTKPPRASVLAIRDFCSRGTGGTSGAAARGGGRRLRGSSVRPPGASDAHRRLDRAGCGPASSRSSRRRGARPLLMNRRAYDAM